MYRDRERRHAMRADRIQVDHRRQGPFRYAGYDSGMSSTAPSQPLSDGRVRSRRELGSVANALRLVELLARTTDAGVTDLARQLGISKASVDRLLTTLVSAGFVEQDPQSRRYRLSLKIVLIAEAVRGRIGIVDVARPRLLALSDEVQEAVNLGVLVDGALVFAEMIPSTHVFRFEPRPGTALPAYCTSAGKTLLAFVTAAKLDRYLATVVPARHTSATLTTVARIRAELEEIRRVGYALDRGELIEEAWCVAAPVLGGDGLAVAAVSVTMPRSHFELKRESVIAAVTVAARDIGDRVALVGVSAPTSPTSSPATPSWSGH